SIPSSASRHAVSLPYPASASTMPMATPAALAARICSSAICGLVLNFRSPARVFFPIPTTRRHNADGNARGFGRAKLFQRDLRLGLKLQLLWHTGFFSPLPILTPLLPPVQAPVDRD